MKKFKTIFILSVFYFFVRVFFQIVGLTNLIRASIDYGTPFSGIAIYISKDLINIIFNILGGLLSLLIYKNFNNILDSIKNILHVDNGNV